MTVRLQAVCRQSGPERMPRGQAPGVDLDKGGMGMENENSREPWLDADLVRDRRVLVTGGTGFVGSRVVPMLLRAGAKVTLLCRPGSHVDCPDSVRVVRTDLARGEEIFPEMRACDIFIHMAALLFGLSWRDYLSANCAASRHLANQIARAGSHGPERVILVSSLAAAGPCAAPEGRTEEDVATPVSAYGWSKLLSENIFRAAAGDRLVVLRPPIIYGSGDRGLLPVYRGLKKGIGVVPGIRRDFPVSILHVDDMAQAVLLACKGHARGIYHLGDGDVWPMADFYRAAAHAMGRRARMIHLPLWFMGLTAGLSTFFAKGLASSMARGRRAPNWNMDKYREAAAPGWVASNRRIVEELGFRPGRNLESGMAETMQGNRALRLL